MFSPQRFSLTTAGTGARALGLALLVLGVNAAIARAGDAVTLAQGGQARLPIVIGPAAAERTAAAAADLADYLQRISGASFTVERGDGARGIVVGVPGDFTALPLAQTFDAHPFNRDHYRLVSTSAGIYLLGATPQAAEFAVWDLLSRFGYRMYFASPTWEIVPRQEQLTLEVDVLEKPSYYDRSGPRGAMRLSSRPWALEGWRHWCIRNRTAQAFELNTGHAYDTLIRRNQAAFDTHPEFFPKINGKRGQARGNKICIGNPDLRQLVVDHVIRTVEAAPELDSISLDPSDGGGWCDHTCELCAPLGSVSDRVVLLANQVAQALEAKFERTYYIGIYAYNDYSLPPTIKVHPHVIVSLATAFIKGNQTFDDMLQGWSAQTKYIGIREYYGVAAWGTTMPGRGRAGNVDYLVRTIPKFHASGARFMNAEADAAWGPNGLGYYLASRFLWNVNEAAHAQEIIDDFVTRSFGSARQPMATFYAMITGPSRPRLSEHLVGRMYQLLKEARALTDDPAVRARLNDLVLYTRHVELNRVYEAARGDDRMPALSAVMTHTWRIRKTMMADSLGYLSLLNRTVRQKDNGLTWGEGYTAVRPPDSMRVDEDKPFSEAEIVSLIEQGIAANPTLSFEPVAFSTKLAPAAPLQLDAGAALERNSRTRGRAEYFTWLTHANQSIELTMTTGTVYNVRGNAEVILQQWDEDDQDFVNVEQKEIPPDQQPHQVILHGRSVGLHRVVVSERMSGTTTVWPSDLPCTTPCSMEQSRFIVGRDNWYFYVPKGTRVLGAYADSTGGVIADPAGKTVFSFEDKSFSDYLAIPVPPGQDGKLWSAQRIAGKLQLLTVPPYGADRPENLLLPEDVVRADAAAR